MRTGFHHLCKTMRSRGCWKANAIFICFMGFTSLISTPKTTQIERALPNMPKPTCKTGCHCREKNVHDHHGKKIFWGTFLASKKNFPGRWWIQKPYENQENNIYNRNLSSVAPIFFGKEKFLTGAGRCMLPFSQHCGLCCSSVSSFLFYSLRG